MQDYNTIMGVIQMRLVNCSYEIVQRRHNIGSGTVTLIMNRFHACGLSYEQLKCMEPVQVQELFYPPANLQRRGIPEPDFQNYYDRIHAKDSRVNISFCWYEYKKANPDGYSASQFYERYNQFVEKNYGAQDAKMPVERIPGERMYIDWVGDQPELLTDPETGELLKVHIFATTLGLGNLIYAEIFMDEKMPRFIEGTANAVKFYGGVAKYFVPDNLRTAIKKHTKDELVLQSAYSDLEDFYNTIVLPPPPYKPKGKPTIEGHVRFLETHLVEELKKKIYTSLEELNAETRKIVAALNSRPVQGSKFTRQEAFEKYDKPCMKPLPGGDYTVCDYKPFLKIPDNYHLEYDGHYYSVLYTYRGQPAILKATSKEIRICDRYNRLICKHNRSYREFPRYVTEDSHMKPEHLYYKEVNAKDGAYYRRWASVYGPHMSEFIDRLLKSSKHEAQSYNSCAGLLHTVKDLPHGIVEETARTCIEMNNCWYSTFKRVLGQVTKAHQYGSAGQQPEVLPAHENIRGKDYYR